MALMVDLETSGSQLEYEMEENLSLDEARLCYDGPTGKTEEATQHTH